MADCILLKNDSIVKPYTGNMCVQEIPRNFILISEGQEGLLFIQRNSNIYPQ